MQRIKTYIKGHKKLVGGTLGGLVLVLILSLIFGGNGNGNSEIVAVEKRDVVDEVRIAGTVEARIVADLGLESSGIVRSVNVEVNDRVFQGQTLMSLGLGTLPAELQSAQAQVAIKRANTANTTINLDALQEKQDTLVDNALSELFSEGLTAEPQSLSYTQTPPLISGRYVGSEGTYKIHVKPGRQSGTTDVYVFGMDDIEPIEVNETGSTPLGDRGLSITFLGDPINYRNTIWYVEIPNKQSASYATNFSAYESSVRERERALDEARAELRAQESGSSIADAELAGALAEVARIQALIGERILTAPFNGVVTAVNVDPGEIASANESGVSIISDDGFGVEVDLPEIDSIKVKNGNTASVMLDALSEEKLSAHVVSVNRTETVVDGISVYEARLTFDREDERIASGMTADVTIVTDEKSDVLALPARSIRYREDGKPYVLVSEGTTSRESDVALGLRGSDGYIEILAGVSLGESVVIPD